MSSELVPIPRRELARAGIENLPAAIGRAGEAAAWRFIEFFAADDPEQKHPLRLRGSRLAILRVVREASRVYARTSEADRRRLLYREPPRRGAHREAASRGNQDALRFSVTGQIVPMNPAASVRGPKHVVHRGKTPVLTADQARTLLDSIKWIPSSDFATGALIGLMCYTFARVSAVVHMRVEDYYENGKRGWIRLHEKGG